MFSGFDLSAIGNVVGEALKNASNDLESGVSSALGIDPNKASEEPLASATGPALHEQTGGMKQEEQRPKKIVKKIIKKAPAPVAPDNADDARTDAAAAASPLAPVTTSSHEAHSLPDTSSPGPATATKKKVVRVVKVKPVTPASCQAATSLPSGDNVGAGVGPSDALSDPQSTHLPSSPPQTLVVSSVEPSAHATSGSAAVAVKQADVGHDGHIYAASVNCTSSATSASATSIASCQLPHPSPPKDSVAQPSAHIDENGNHYQSPTSSTAQRMDVSSSNKSPSLSPGHDHSILNGSSTMSQSSWNQHTGTVFTDSLEAARERHHSSATASKASTGPAAAAVKDEILSSDLSLSATTLSMEVGSSDAKETDSLSNGDQGLQNTASRPILDPRVSPLASCKGTQQLHSPILAEELKSVNLAALQGASLEEFEDATLTALPRVALEALAVQLQRSVMSEREQVLRDAEQMTALNQLVAKLQEKNEELALRSSRVSEQDLEEMRSEFEQRLAAADRKVYALTKERDALKKGSEKLTEYSSLMKEKDAIIKQVLEEGEALASKQAELELNIKKLKQQLRSVESDRDRLQAKLEAEQMEAETQRKGRAKAERELVASHEQSKAELEIQRAQYEGLLEKSRAEQADAEEHARCTANAELTKRVKDADSRAEALAESVGELREALERQRQAANLREEMLRQDMVDLERRSQAAELRHQELSAKLPEAARPLLRQIEAMQAAANAQADTWAAAEQLLQQRIADSEARAAAAAERERLASERAGSLAARVAGFEAGAQAGREEQRVLQEQLDAARHQVELMQERCRVAQQQVELLQERLQLMDHESTEAARIASEAVQAERQARQVALTDSAAVSRELERRVAELESQLAQARAQNRMSTTGGGGDSTGAISSVSSNGAEAQQQQQQPTMAAPGYRWVLLKEGDTGLTGIRRREASPTPSTTSPVLTAGSGVRAIEPPAAASQDATSHLSSTHQAGSHPSTAMTASTTPFNSDHYTLQSLLLKISNEHQHAIGAHHHHDPTSGTDEASPALQQQHGTSSVSSLGGPGPSLTMPLGGPLMTAGAEALRMELRMKMTEISALEARVKELTLTRDQLAEELVSSTKRSEQASDALATAASLRKEVEMSKQRYVAAVELLGERDEALEELRADLQDVKNLYRDQIEYLVKKLTEVNSELKSQVE
ncbi:hypothetical protein CEUSTIGMA_g10381.t1 [Chlamydomonas eustigma]|uniref:TATA element modulatory factor 1 TATA binding domain-containing protein n=1 Tax=Chlamydomonas eustigma TaxID=1157962 RepID=A0A250XIP7_9CHLO|nr:hypothetical protein CEUSTIGMA_g10381.t1 [Chlamydomonas eustigma]|eukprot:GAX82954.1 hypothetical protein CEUSTIGMA_g10381.t1 [Chlamydomonas eustigma]